MEIFNQVQVTSSVIADAGNPIAENSNRWSSMAIYLSALKLEDGDSPDAATLRNVLRDGLGSMAPEARKEMVSLLNELAGVTVGTDVGELLHSKLPEVKKEAQKGTGIDRLLELLFMLMMLLGQANTARNDSAAKFGEIAVKQAQATGGKGVDAAVSNFGGALGGMLLGTIIAGVGFREFSKGTAGQVKNISTNGRDSKQLYHETTQSGNALNRPASPLTGVTPQERVSTLDAQGRPVPVQINQPHLSSGEHAVLNQPANRTDVRIHAQEMSQQENYQKYAEQQYRGQLISSFGPQTANMVQSAAAVGAAAQTSAGKINEAQGALASNMQRNEEQTAQRSAELLTKIFSLIVTSSEQSRSTLDAMSQSIKA